MEPKNDSELRELLQEWKAPETPPSLESRVLNRPRNWWRVLLHGYIRVPVPVACCLAILMIAGVWRLTKPPAAGCSAANVSSPAVGQRLPADSHDQTVATACAAHSGC